MVVTTEKYVVMDSHKRLGYRKCHPIRLPDKLGLRVNGAI